MSTKQFKDHLRKEVEELRADYYSSEGDAFCHWALRTYLELEDDEAFEACDVGGPGDRGLDAFWHDEEQQRIILAQAKYSQRRGKIGAEPITELLRAYKWLLRLASGGSKQTRRELRAAAKELARSRKEDSDYPIELICFGNRQFSAEAEQEAEAIKAELDEGISLKLVGIDQLEEAVDEQRSRLDKPPGRITLELEKHFVFDPEDAPRTIVASVNVRELANIEHEYHYRIFQQNVRYFLKSRNRVNKGIANTLSTPEGRSKFWYYNNGIAIVCDRIEVLDADAEPAKAVIKNLQIVNGCQTTTTLGDLADELEAESDSPAYVLVRFVESADLDLQGEISRFNNRQNAVKDRDLLSNDEPQSRLQREFRELNPPWFYERKRGQWDAEVKPSAPKRRRYGDRRIDNEAAAQAAYAFWRDPAVARARKRMLFVRKSEDQAGLYDQIFTESSTPEWFLVPFLVQKYVARRKKAYMRELKSVFEALETTRPSVKDKRITGRQWLKFADQMIVGAIRLYWEQHIDVTRIKEQRALLSEESFQPAVAAAYELALRDLSPFFRSKVTEGEKRDEPFDAANFVKGNWPEVREWIEDQLEYADNRNAFRGIPAFET